MPVYERNGIWQIDITTPSGKRIRRSAKTQDEKAAQELHDKLKHESWRIEEVGDKPEHYWEEACVRWIKERSDKKSIRSDICRIRQLTEFRGKVLSELSKDIIESSINRKQISGSTKNRYLALIGAILKKCEREWGWIDRSPSLKSFKEPKKRIRWINRHEALRLINALPEIYGRMAEFSLMTGLRQSNVLGLKWDQIDMQRSVAWIHADQTKSGRALGVPLNRTALSILQKQIGSNLEYVFVRKDGERFNGVSSDVWKRALQKSGISDFRWHDLRHTWASWLVQSGVPLMELKELGGWETLEMVQRYAHLSPEHLHDKARILDFYHDANTSHEKKPLSLMLGS